MLVSSADGVGTKLKVAFATGRHDTVGEDLVNHCVNDIAVQGATPLFFLDYFAAGQTRLRCVRQSGGRHRARLQAEWLRADRRRDGGDARHVPSRRIRFGGLHRRRCGAQADADRHAIEPGDAISACRPGLHTNGYSLARKLLFEIAGHAPDARLAELSGTLAEEFLKTHRSYLKPLQALHRAKFLKGAAHITGGGITDNVPRILPRGTCAVIKRGSWPNQPIFELLQRLGNLPEDDYRRTFNLGVGMVLVVPEKKFGFVSQILKKMREPFHKIGHVEQHKTGKPKVVYQ